MLYKFSYLLHIIIIFINIKYLKTFNVNFHYNYNLHVEPFNTQIYKRELNQFFDKASFSFNGLEKVEAIPALFPIDICVFSLEGTKYATALHMKKNGARHFEVFKKNNGSYESIADIPSPNGIAMDCINFNNKGYVAIALNLTKTIQYSRAGSPIYEIIGNRIRAVQYFAATNLTSVYLRASGNDFFLLHTYANSLDTPNLYCPYFKWSGSTFNKLGRIPCSNARQLAPFSIDYESYVAVANYADLNGYTSTYSVIYKYSRAKKKFVSFQKIKTNGAVDVQYFYVPHNEERKHFLVFGNSINTASLTKRAKNKRESNNLDADSVFYLFDKGQFIPYQKLSFYAVKKFLPVQNVEAEKFILLVACTDQDIKIYNFNDWKFEESKVQFTEGALGKGVSNMRIYQENQNSYLVIANKLMGDNETNIFLPIFKQEQHANVLRQQIIDWCKTETQRLKTIDINGLRKLVEEKLRNIEQLNYWPKIQDIPQANIQTVTTESLVYPKLNMSRDYWLALNYVNQALNSLEEMLKQKQRLKRDAVFSSNDNFEHVYETLNVKTLKVNKYLKAKIVNKVNSTKPEFENIKAQKVIVSRKFTEPSKERVNPMEILDRSEVMTVKNLKINGKLNEYLWSDLHNNTLKRKEEIQFLKAPIQVETLKTDTIVVNDDKINEQHLGALIPIDSGKYVINQDIQFETPITVNQLQVLERLNNLHVFNGRFDALLKKSNDTQVIEGLKNVTSIKVMKPITTAGKVMGAQLEAISPNKFIHEPLILQGNFMITRDVHINQQLTALDLIDLKEKLSTRKILDMGIRMDKNLKDINLKFLQPLMSNNSIVSFINQHDLQRLVKVNQDDIHVVEGKKIFNNSLEIRSGFSEVKNLNGIDLEKLESNAFLKNNNQTIKVPMRIGKISAKSIESPVILLNSKNLSDYLTINGNQSIQGSLIVENLKAQSIAVEHLNTNSKIYHQNLQDIYLQKPCKGHQEYVFKKNRKFEGSIYVQNLILNSTINNKSIEIIENQIMQLEGNIKYVGNFKFNYPMSVTRMTFQGKLNDIHAEEFGKCWLQKNAVKQVFTADQTFATISAEGGIQLKSKLNGFTMEEFYTKTYWTNRNEYIPCVNFENPLEIKTHLTTKTLNNYKVPQDVFYKNDKGKPIILNSMTVNENLIVQGSIVNLTSINNINLSKLQEFLDGFISQTLYVESAYFVRAPPLYKTLNCHYIRQTIDSVWLANENVILPHHVEINEAIFQGLLEFEGPINNINLDYLNDNYFSKTKPQDISVEIKFSKDAIVEKEINTNYIQVHGTLIEGKSGIPFDFDEFVQNTLKTSGPHIISGNWSVADAIVEGNLNGILINQLNLVDDIMHIDKPTQAYQLRAPKIFKNVHIKNLYSDSSSLINRVPVANWIKDAVYLYGNYTIKGVTTIDSVNILNNLMVFGKVNNITFNEYTILLKTTNQHLPANLKIVSHLTQEKRFLTNNIEHLYAGYINGQHIPSFIENLVPAAKTVAIKSHLTFKHVLKVERYEGPDRLLSQNQWAKRNIDHPTQLNKNPSLILKEFNEIKYYLSNISKNKPYKLDHFDILQVIEAKATELVMLSLKFESMIVDILAVLDMQDRTVAIYKWISEEKKFRKTTEYDWLPQNPLLLKIIHKRFARLQQPIEEKKLKIFIRHDMNVFHKHLFDTNNIHKYYEFSNETCLEYQNSFQNSMEIRIFCLNAQKSETLIINSNDKVQQIISFGKEFIALLTNNSVIIYDTSLNSTKVSQKLTAAAKPKQIALGSFKNYQFLAVLYGRQLNTLTYGFVEIYRSKNSVFTLFQSLKCSEPEQVEFSFVEKSNDLLIHVLTNSLIKPYLIYQYQGVMGFREILSDSILPANSVGFNTFNLYSSKQHLVALNGQNKITLIELVVNQI